MTMILNLTQHRATKEQLEAGVVDLDENRFAALKRLLTFEVLPTAAEIDSRAKAIVALAAEGSADPWLDFNVMIGGAPFLMTALEYYFHRRGVQALYAFSAREVVETMSADGTVTKTAVFKHLGFTAPYESYTLP